MLCAGFGFQDTSPSVSGDDQAGVVNQTHGWGPKPVRDSRRDDICA
jgi:hypothetical protein